MADDDSEDVYSEDVCGESYDHDLMLIAERDGYASYECRACGAEVVSEPDDEEKQP